MIMKRMHWIDWRVCGVFAAKRNDILRLTAKQMSFAVGIDNIVYLCSKKRKGATPYSPVFYLENMSTKRSNEFLQVASFITKRTLLILDDIETIRNYPQSMTRNIINHLAPLTRYKIIAGQHLVTKLLADLYAPFAVLDKRVLHANHYWCFAEDHREVSVFDGKTIIGNKDTGYLAAKLKPFIYLDSKPETDLQAELYAAIQAAPFVERVQDISGLRLK